MIIIEELMPVEFPVEGTEGIRTVRKDMLMLLICGEGRERSAIEYDGLAKQAGFTSFRVVSKVRDSTFSVMEAHK